MKSVILETEHKNRYLYSDKNKDFIYIPKGLEKIMKGDADGTEKDDYYKRKYDFLKDNGFLTESHYNFTTRYAERSLEYNLANLRSLLFEVTDGCNLSCKYCGYGELYNNYDERNNKKMSFEDAKCFIDFLNTFWHSSANVSYNNTIVVGFYGGEPLMNMPLIKEIITYLESLDITNIHFKYNMTTNAVLLDRYMDYLIDKDFQLLISLDGSRKNNQYRIMKNGQESFDLVFKNINLLRIKCPTYYESNVNFNAVIHNQNSSEEVINFIGEKLEKKPRVTELNTNGVSADKEEEFRKIFIERSFTFKKDSFDDSDKLDWLFADSRIILFNAFIEAYLSNTYHAYPDIFPSRSEKYIPTGTCKPFSRKIFLTVNGKILPCERVGQQFALGWVKDGKVDMDLEQVANFYQSTLEKVLPQCSRCILWRNCSLCVFYVKEKEGKRTCTRFIPESKAFSYLSRMISFVESTPKLYKRLIQELVIY